MCGYFVARKEKEIKCKIIAIRSLIIFVPSCHCDISFFSVKRYIERSPWLCTWGHFLLLIAATVPNAGIKYLCKVFLPLWWSYTTSFASLP